MARESDARFRDDKADVDDRKKVANRLERQRFIKTGNRRFQQCTDEIVSLHPTLVTTSCLIMSHHASPAHDDFPESSADEQEPGHGRTGGFPPKCLSDWH
jgi:hypothetical protein